MRDVNIVKIYIAESNLQAEMILEALKDAGIPALKQDLGPGGIMNLYGGNSMWGEEIYVAETAVEKAKSVLDAMGLTV